MRFQPSRKSHENSCETYRKNICPNNPECVITGDVKNITIKKLAPIDAFAYGFPCNDFSIVGEQNGFEGKYGPLYTYGVKVLNIHKPLWFFAENVGGIRSANNGSAFEKILYDLENADPGYNLTTHLYKFEEYGIPQTRHRIVIIGFRKDLGMTFKVPSPTTLDQEDQLTARVALETPPIPGDALNHEFTNHPKKITERLAAIPPGENAWYEKLPKHLQLNVQGAKLSQIYRRLHPDRPSYTITGSGGGGTHGYHWDEPRALTNRERARLQTFPDEFEFVGGKESVRRQIGMAVPPQGARIILEAVLKCFADIQYDYIKPNWKRGDLQLPIRFPER